MDINIYKLLNIRLIMTLDSTFGTDAWAAEEVRKWEERGGKRFDLLTRFIAAAYGPGVSLYDVLRRPKVVETMRKFEEYAEGYAE